MFRRRRVPWRRLFSRRHMRVPPEVAEAKELMRVGKFREAAEPAEQAIHLLIDANRPARVRQVLPRVLAALERHGRQVEMERL